MSSTPPAGNIGDSRGNGEDQPSRQGPTMTALLRLHFPDGALPAGSRFRAVCHCGYATSPRARSELAYQALLNEHGWSNAVDGCGICGWNSDAARIGQVIAGRQILQSPPCPWDV
jgi:hypothetical protein